MKKIGETTESKKKTEGNKIIANICNNYLSDRHMQLL